MTSSRRAHRAPAHAFVHLGDRLLAIGRVQTGVMTPTQAARSLGVSAEEIREWQKVYAGDRNFSLAEYRVRAMGEKGQLTLRARRLAGLVAKAEKDLRDLHLELIRAVGSPSVARRAARRASK
jgi:hypothetical protein